MLGSPLSISELAAYERDRVVISALSPQAIGNELTAMGASNMAAVGWPGNNHVLAWQFGLAEPFLVRKLWYHNGGGTGANVSVGVYDEPGTTLLVTSGTKVTAVINSIEEFDCTDTLLPAGRYWWAMVCASASVALGAFAPAIELCRAMGVAKMAGATPLGATFTPVACTHAYIPFGGISGRVLTA